MGGIDRHTKPVLGVRVAAPAQDWLRAEAARREIPAGQLLEDLIYAERRRTGQDRPSEQEASR